MSDKYITITGFQHYYGLKPFKIGNTITLKKMPENEYDSEAIRAEMPIIGTVGYVANSPQTTANGTMSAGRIYDHIGDICRVEVMFTTHTKVICKVLHSYYEKDYYEEPLYDEENNELTF
jgi:hypothetical protein